MAILRGVFCAPYTRDGQVHEYARVYLEVAMPEGGWSAGVRVEEERADPQYVKQLLPKIDQLLDHEVYVGRDRNGRVDRIVLDE